MTKTTTPYLNGGSELHWQVVGKWGALGEPRVAECWVERIPGLEAHVNAVVTGGLKPDEAMELSNALSQASLEAETHNKTVYSGEVS